MEPKSVESGDVHWDSLGEDREKRARHHSTFKNR